MRKTPGERSDIAHLMGERKLNLGCGLEREPSWNGWVNADINHKVAPDEHFDATGSWPFPDEDFDSIYAFCMLHCIPFGAPIFCLFTEAWRVLRPGGWFVGVVPEGPRGNPMALSIWMQNTPTLLCKASYSGPLAGWEQDYPIMDWSLGGVQPMDGGVFRFALQKGAR
jgi:SAM-dependent methyltransferase